MSNNRLWYKQQAKDWVEALPVGNGFMGAMGFGGEEGLYDLSENTCWSGEKQENQVPKNAAYYMKKGREALRNGEVELAHQLFKKCQGNNHNYGTQLPMGKLYLTINDKCSEQTRELNIEDGVLTDELIFDKKKITRKLFASHEERSIRFSLDGEISSMNVNLVGLNPMVQKLDDNCIKVDGIALENQHSDGLHGVKYTMILKFETDGKSEWSRYGLHVENATYVKGIVYAQTDYRNADIEALLNERISVAQEITFEKSLETHLASHRELMNRCVLKLPKNSNSDLPTDERRKMYETDKTDLELISLFFEYGKYVILDSSRVNSELPAALQGVWNDNRAARMCWTDDMHLDINTQMNYFAVDLLGIGECERPLFNFLKNVLMPSGEEVAKSLYCADGWIAHVVTNAHGFAAPGWSTQWGFFLTGGAWMALDIWRHYRYSLDKEFLAEYYPVMKGAAQCLSELLELDEEGNLVLNPSISPENMYVIDGKPYAMVRGSVVDTTVCRCLFDAVINSAEILGDCDEFTQTLKSQVPLLPDFKIGSRGQLLEWMEEYEEFWPDHRHTSHLMALYPFETIDCAERPDLAKACAKSIDMRSEMDGGDIILTNWAANLLLAYYAKMQIKEKTTEIIDSTMTRLSRDNLMVTHDGPTTLYTGGIYELDGNTGLTAGICEMLLQSKGDDLRVFPCLPNEWKCGEIKGIHAPGKVTLDLSWDENTVTVKTENNIPCVVYQGEKTENATGTITFNRKY